MVGKIFEDIISIKVAVVSFFSFLKSPQSESESEMFMNVALWEINLQKF